MNNAPRIAVLSLHTSPLVVPGRGDAGGMNVYIRELVSSLAQTGVDATVFVRRWDDETADVVDIEPGFRVVHISAGEPDMSKEALPEIVDDFAAGVRKWLERNPVDALHANYWLSGVAAHQLKHDLGLPLASTFHTLARVKAATGDVEPLNRIRAETEVMACSDVITANSTAEVQQLTSLYKCAPERIRILSPGVDQAFFSPGAQKGARAALGLGDEPVLLFVGRIQPLKGVCVTAEVLAELADDYPDAKLLIVGGASGVDGEGELACLRETIATHGLGERVRIDPPQPHHLLATYYRAADVCLVPSRSESFGLVALEAAACGIPVVAADVGGLRTLVIDGETGFRVAERSSTLYADAVRRILGDPALAAEMRTKSVASASGYTWASMAVKLKALLLELIEKPELVGQMDAQAELKSKRRVLRGRAEKKLAACSLAQ